MDTSKQYIKMCQEAHEIQYLRKISDTFDVGDYINSDGESRLAGLYNDGSEISKEVRGNTDFWLPRQDQLQEIFFKDKVLKSPLVMINYLYGFSKREEFEPYEQNNGLITSSFIKLKTMEAVWLNFTMKEKFNKDWNFETETWEVCKIKE